MQATKRGKRISEGVIPQATKKLGRAWKLARLGISYI